MCIYGCGCQGILDEPSPELEQGCCSYGAHFVDADDVANVERSFARVTAEHMQFHADAVEHGITMPGELDDDPARTTSSRPS